MDLLGSGGAHGLSAEVPRHGRRGVHRDARQNRQGRIGHRPGACAGACRCAARRRSARAPHGAGTRGSRADGRRPVERRNRPRTLGDRRNGREARPQHPHENCGYPRRKTTTAACWRSLPTSTPAKRLSPLSPSRKARIASADSSVFATKPALELRAIRSAILGLGARRDQNHGRVVRGTRYEAPRKLDPAFAAERDVHEHDIWLEQLGFPDCVGARRGTPAIVSPSRSSSVWAAARNSWLSSTMRH